MNSSVRVFSAGFLAGLAGGLAMLGARPFSDAPSLQELLVDRLLLLVSPHLFSFVLSQVWDLGKTLAVTGATLSLAFGGGLLSLLVARLFPSRAGRPRFP